MYWIPVIDSSEDALCLQRDLNAILNWTKRWQMQLNIDKCAVIRCTKSLSLIKFDYKLNDQPLELKEQHQCLDIIFHQNMHWSHHIQATYVQ